MNRVIDKIEIHHQFPESYFVIYYYQYDQYMNYEKKFNIYHGDEDDLERMFNESMDDLRIKYNVEIFFHQKKAPNINTTTSPKQAKRPNGYQYEKIRTRANVKPIATSLGSFEKKRGITLDSYNKMRIKKLIVKAGVFSIIAATVTIGYHLYKKNCFQKALAFHDSKMIEYHNPNNKMDKDDSTLFEEYYHFQQIFTNLKNEDYENVEKRDIDFFMSYLSGLFDSNNDNYDNSSYRSSFILEFIDEFNNLPSNATIKVGNIERAYNSIFGYDNNKAPVFNQNKANEYCKLLSDFVIDDYTYKILPKSEKLILLMQLRSVITKTHYNYPTYSNPNSRFFSRGYNYDDFINYLDNEISILHKDLQSSCSKSKKV